MKNKNNISKWEKKQSVGPVEKIFFFLAINIDNIVMLPKFTVSGKEK